MNDTKPQLGQLGVLATVAARVLSRFAQYGLEIRVKQVFGMDLGETVVHIRVRQAEKEQTDG